MRVYIPLATGQNIPNFVIKSLASQVIPCDIIPCCTPGIINSNHNVEGLDRSKKRLCEMASRNLAMDMIKVSGEEFVAMQDRDVMHLFPGTYDKALKYLTSNKNIGIVSLPYFKDKTTHIIMKAVVFRVELLIDFRFRVDNRQHMCSCMTDDAKAQGFGCEYVPSDEIFVKEI